MSHIALWVAAEDRLTPVHAVGVLERRLEDWVYNHPEIITSDLVWLYRQGTLPDRSRFDLLGFRRTQGTWVIAELKSGPVGLHTLMQTLHYAVNVGTLSTDALRAFLPQGGDDEALIASALEAWEAGERPIELMLIGTGESDRLAEASAFLKQRGLNLEITAVTLQVFERDGAHFVARAVETVAEAAPRGTSTSLDDILQRATDCGVRAETEAFARHASEAGLRTRAWPYSFTVMSPAKATKTLIYVRPLPDRRLGLGYAPETIATDLGLAEDVVRRALGEPPWREVSPDEARRFLDAWRATVDSSTWARAHNSKP